MVKRGWVMIGAPARNLELEAAVKELLETYDKEMFEFHQKIADLEEQWGREKEELSKVEARLAVIGAEKAVIVKEQEEEEARIRNLKVEELMRRR